MVLLVVGPRFCFEVVDAQLERLGSGAWRLGIAWFFWVAVKELKLRYHNMDTW